MPRKPPVLTEEQRLATAQEYYDACMEDLETLVVLYKKGFQQPHNACMIMARATEKMIKYRLLIDGKNADWIHDQAELMRDLGFSDNDYLLVIASQFTSLAVQANYPSTVRGTISTKTALVLYDDAYNLISSLASMSPPVRIIPRPRKALFEIRLRRKMAS